MLTLISSQTHKHSYEKLQRNLQNQAEPRSIRKQHTIGLHQILDLCKEPWEILHFVLHWCILGNLGGFAFWAAVVHSWQPVRFCIFGCDGAHILGNLLWHPCKKTFSQNCSLRRPHLKCSLSPPPPAKIQATHSPRAKPWKASKKYCCLKAWRHVHLLKQNVPLK